MISHRMLIFSAGSVWLAVGTLLLCIGISLTNLMPLMLIAGGIGYLKGRFVMARAANKQVARITALQTPLSFRQMYTKGYYLLILFMMGLGMSLRFLPVPQNVRAFVDIAVGIALIMGALQYYISAVRLRTS